MLITDIETDLVYLKTIEESDYDDLKEYLTDEFTMRFFDHGILGEDGIRDLMKRTNRVFLIVHKRDKKVIGHFFYGDWFMTQTKEIGWVLNKEYQNQGIITELGKHFIKFAFEEDKMHRIVATCQPENIASKRVCEKIGLRLEGEFKKCIYVKRTDEWWNELFFAILDEEYKTRKDK